MIDFHTPTSTTTAWSEMRTPPALEIRGIDYTPKISSNKPLYVVILGNGFDIDLGLKTKYSEFAISPEWPFKERTNSYKTLGGFLNTKKDIDKWFDIEEALAEYANSVGAGADVEADKKDFQLLKSGLKEYLERQQNSFVGNDESRARKILLFISYIAHKYKYHIYTFNYTDVALIAKKFGIDIDPKHVKHIHGSLAGDDIILGVGEQHKLPQTQADGDETAGLPPWNRMGERIARMKSAGNGSGPGGTHAWSPSGTRTVYRLRRTRQYIA